MEQDKKRGIINIIFGCVMCVAIICMLVLIGNLNKTLETTNEKLDAQNYQMQHQKTQLEYLNNQETAIKNAIIDLNNKTFVSDKTITEIKFRKDDSTSTTLTSGETTWRVTIYNNGFVLVYSYTPGTSSYYLPMDSIYYIEYAA